MATPRFWLWAGTAPAGIDPRYVVQIVRTSVGAATTGTQAADAVCDDIEERGLADGQIAILLQSYGHEGRACVLMRHPDDAVGAGPDNPAHTLFSAAGRAACLAWFTDFKNRYVARGVPNPDRIFWDYEEVPQVGSPGSGAGMIGPGGTWTAMLADARWTTEVLDGLQTGSQWWADRVGEGKAVDMAQAWFNGQNKTTGSSQSIQAFAYRCTEWAMKPVYDLIHATWPNCKTSNYDSSNQTLSSLPFKTRWTAQTWFDLNWVSEHADLQSPVLYPPKAEHNDGSQTAAQLYCSFSERNLQACLNGSPTREIVPWLMNAGETWEGHKVTREDNLALFRAARACGADEFLIWDNAAADWVAFNSAVRTFVGEGKRNRRRRWRKLLT